MFEKALSNDNLGKRELESAFCRNEQNLLQKILITYSNKKQIF